MIPLSQLLVLFAKEWRNSSSVARVFSIGKQEAAAVSNIMSKIDPLAVRFLTDSVRSRGVKYYIQHEVIGKDLLNLHFTSGIGERECWKEEFRNMDDGELDPWACSSDPHPRQHRHFTAWMQGAAQHLIMAIVVNDD